MAAQINTVTNQRQPILMSKVEDDTQDNVTGAVFTPNEDGIISVSEDKSVRIWLKRETGQYWPSVCQFLSSSCTVMFYSPETRTLFIGLDNGTIEEFEVSDDYNRITQKRTYTAHQKKVTGCLFSHETEVLIACGADKYITWHWTQNGQRLSGYLASSSPTSLQYDKQSHYVFAGMSNGEITVLKINKSDSQLITTLKGHSGSISCLCWDPSKEILYSGSSDKSIILWDIGSQKGTAIELQGHNYKVTSLHFNKNTNQLLSTDSRGTLAVWNMEIKRNETAVWQEADQCTRCRQPFFWNFKQMWSDKTVGLRQHHCRKCGIAVCDTCSSKRSTIPMYGFENEVRICDECFQSISEEDRAPTATFHDLKQNIIGAFPEWSRGFYVTCGTDRTMKARRLMALFNRARRIARNIRMFWCLGQEKSDGFRQS